MLLALNACTIVYLDKTKACTIAFKCPMALCLQHRDLLVLYFLVTFLGHCRKVNFLFMGMNSPFHALGRHSSCLAVLQESPSHHQEVNCCQLDLLWAEKREGFHVVSVSKRAQIHICVMGCFRFHISDWCCIC